MDIRGKIIKGAKTGENKNSTRGEGRTIKQDIMKITHDVIMMQRA